MQNISSAIQRALPRLRSACLQKFYIGRLARDGALTMQMPRVTQCETQTTCDAEHRWLDTCQCQAHRHGPRHATPRPRSTHTSSPR